MLLSTLGLMVAVAGGPPPPSVVVMTYNVLFEGGETSKTLDLIEREDPSLLCLQEVTPRFVRAFEERLAKRYPHRKWAPKNGTWGVGIISKHRVTRHRVFAQRPHRMPAMEATVHLDENKQFVVSCAHLFPPGAKRRKDISLLTAMTENAQLRIDQAKGLIDRYAKENRPVLLLGDMNESSDDSAVTALLSAGFSLACAIEGADCGATYPGATTLLPAVFQVDHILGRGGHFTFAKVEKSGGSDHYPVIARFVLDL